MASMILSRFVAFSVLGSLFLLIYEVVFMTRTSAARDWNHIHNSRFTLPEVQRFVLHNVSTPSIGHYLGESTFPEYFTDVKVARYESIEKLNGHALPTLSALFAMPNDNPSFRNQKTIELHHKDLFVKKGLRSPIKYLVDRAQRSGAKAVYLQVSPEWVPNIGLQRHKLPVILATAPPPEILNLTLRTHSASTKEWTLNGFTADSIIVGDSRGSRESTALFLEITRVFHYLYSQGWMPFRSIKFVSFAHYSAPQWAEAHKSWLRKRGIAYIDCGSLPQKKLIHNAKNRNQTVSISPLLGSLARFAQSHLVNADLLAPLNYTPISCSLGGDAFAFNHQISTISTSFTDRAAAARFLGLVLVTLAQTPILSFQLKDYMQYINTTEFAKIAVHFDDTVDTLRQEFFHEYPWYQLGRKVQSLINRKKANLAMRLFEQSMKIDGRHVIFKSDHSSTGTEVHSVDSQLLDDIIHNLKLLNLFS